MADTEELINKEFLFFDFKCIFFEKLDEDPFIRNNLKTATFNKEYTYRFKKTDVDIIVLYFNISEDYSYIYSPIMYLLPYDDNNEYIDINISWNSKILNGIYYFGQYKFNNLPTRERTESVFDFIEVK